MTKLLFRIHALYNQAEVLRTAYSQLVDGVLRGSVELVQNAIDQDCDLSGEVQEDEDDESYYYFDVDKRFAAYDIHPKHRELEPYVGANLLWIAAERGLGQVVSLLLSAGCVGGNPPSGFRNSGFTQVLP